MTTFADMTTEQRAELEAALKTTGLQVHSTDKTVTPGDLLDVYFDVCEKHGIEPDDTTSYFFDTLFEYAFYGA